MKTETTNLMTLAAMTEDDARAMFERIRWPDGVTCAHCGVIGEFWKLDTRPGLYKCKGCRKQFTATALALVEAGPRVELPELDTRPGLYKCKGCRKQEEGNQRAPASARIGFGFLSVRLAPRASDSSRDEGGATSRDALRQGRGGRNVRGRQAALRREGPRRSRHDEAAGCRSRPARWGRA